MKTTAQQHLTFDAIGTRWQIVVEHPLEDQAWLDLTQRIHDRIEMFDRTYSRFRSDSLVSRMSHRAGTYQLPSDGFTLLSCYEKLFHATAGKVTPLIGQVMSDAGYDAAYSLVGKPLHRPPRFDQVVRYNADSITVKQPVLLDFGAAGKGYLVDLLGECIGSAGAQGYYIDAGGDIRHRATRHQALTVGLENPFDTTEAIGTVDLMNASLCASAGSKRSWQQYTHIIDPQTLQSPKGIAATWVLADDTMTADGLATALFFVEPRTLSDFSFEYARLAADGQLTYSSRFPINLFKPE